MPPRLERTSNPGSIGSIGTIPFNEITPPVKGLPRVESICWSLPYTNLSTTALGKESVCKRAARVIFLPRALVLICAQRRIFQCWHSNLPRRHPEPDTLEELLNYLKLFKIWRRTQVSAPGDDWGTIRWSRRTTSKIYLREWWTCCPTLRMRTWRLNQILLRITIYSPPTSATRPQPGKKGQLLCRHCYICSLSEHQQAIE